MISAVSFVRADAASSTIELERLQTTNSGRGRDEPGVLVVVDGATEEESRRLGESLGPGFMVMADPDGSVAAGAGVRHWPTTASIGDAREARV
jgi:hypothetical protein